MDRTVDAQTQTSPLSYQSQSSARFTYLNDLVKRIFDILASLIGLILISPLLFVIALLIKRDSPGPVFYYGPRLGKGGKTFQILKFRTMHERPESYDGPRVTAQDDPRITPLGRWLRDTKLNELPQLWNVLIGDMSLVGPRPEDPEIAKDWPEEQRNEVLSVRPGITSPASVLYRDEESLLKAEQVMATYLDSILPSKLRLDQLYVRHRSFWLDLDVLFWTFLVLVPRLGSFSPPEELLFLGPVSRLTRRYLSWFMIDTIVTFISIGITGVFWRYFGPLDVGWPKAIGIAIGFSFLFSIASVIFGVNRIDWSNSGAMDALDLLPSMAVATLIAYLINHFLLPKPALPGFLILMASALSYVGFVMVRYRSRLVGGLAWRWLAMRGTATQAKERVLIIGGGEAGQFMSWLLHSSRGSAVFRAIGIVDDDLYKQGSRIQGIQVLGRREDIPQLVVKHDVGIIVFAIHNIPSKERDEVLEICARTPARLVMMPDILGLLNSLVSLDNENSSPGSNLEQQLVCQYCVSQVSPNYLDSWLSDLEKVVQSGDLSSVNLSIQDMKDRIRTRKILVKQISEEMTRSNQNSIGEEDLRE